MTDNSLSVVCSIGEIHFEGNVIPHSWFGHLQHDSGKPNLVAIVILSEVVYWYRPTLVKDERTGRVLGIKKKFKDDKLRRSYGSFAEQFGFTKKQVRDAICFLVEKGVIATELRTVTHSGTKFNNVLFLEPIPNRIAEINTIYDEAPSDIQVTPPDVEDTLHDSQVTPTDVQVTPYIPVSQTNTKITTETTTEITHSQDARKSEKISEELEVTSPLISLPDQMKLCSQPNTSQESKLSAASQQKFKDPMGDRLRRAGKEEEWEVEITRPIPEFLDWIVSHNRQNNSTVLPPRTMATRMLYNSRDKGTELADSLWLEYQQSLAAKQPTKQPAPTHTHDTEDEEAFIKNARRLREEAAKLRNKDTKNV